MSPTPATLDHSFIAPLEKDGTLATFVTVHGSDELLGTRRAVKIGGTLDGHRFEATLMPSGAGPHWLPLRASLCKLIGKHQSGERVEFHLDHRFTRHVPPAASRFHVDASQSR